MRPLALVELAAAAVGNPVEALDRILLDGKYLTATQAEVEKIAAAGIEFAYLVDHQGKIMTIPVNDQ